MDRRTLSMPDGLAEAIKGLVDVERRPVNTQIIILLEEALAARRSGLTLAAFGK